MRISGDIANSVRQSSGVTADGYVPVGEGVRVTSRAERRREPRRQVAYPMTVLTPNDGAGGTEAQTTAEDINSRGVFFYLAQALPLDRVVHLSIAVPPVGHWMQKVIQIRAEGRVVRALPTAEDTPRFGTAVEFVRPLTLRFEGSYAS